MAIYYKFKSAKDFDTIPIDGHFVSVAILKEKIFESKHLGRGTDFDLVVTNVQTGEEYLEEETLLPKGTSVLIRRVPGRPRMPIVAQQQENYENKIEVSEPLNSSFTGADSSTVKYPDENDWDEFGSDLYAIPVMSTVQVTNISQDAPPPTKEDEDSKIQALIETPALDWQQPGDGYGPGRGFVRGGRMMGGRGFGRIGLGPDTRTPPPGYVCHRCKVPGHLIQHCPTNGDPNYDVKRVKPPTGIPKSMLIETPDGSYALPSGSVAVLKPNEAAFEKEIDGLPTTRSIGEIPEEHRCPLCKEIMKDAVITVKCCFATFCDGCIRDYIISKSACVCGQKDVLTDDLIPNKLARDSISRFLECNNNSSAENQGSTYQVKDVESARCPPPPVRVLSPTLSDAPKGEHPPAVEEQNTPKPGVDEEQASTAAPQQTPEIHKSSSKVAASEATHESAGAKEPASQASAPHAEEEVQQKDTAVTGKKIKKKKTRAPSSAADMQWTNGQEFGAESNMMPPMGPAGFDPYWNGMQPGMVAYMPPFGGPMPFMGGYPLGPMDMGYGGFMPPDPYAAPGLMYPPLRPPHPLQRDRPDFVKGFNGGPPPAMSREEFEARKADLRRKREMEERSAGSMRARDLPPRNREATKDTSGGSIATKPKSRAEERDRSQHSHHVYSSSSRRRSPPPRHSPPPESHRDVEIPHPPKRKSSDRGRERYYDDDHRRRDHHHSEKHLHHSSESADRKPADRDSAAAKLNSSIKPSRTESKSTSATTTAEIKSKASVFARISFPDEASNASKKKKMSSSTSTGKASSKHGDGADSSTTLITSSSRSKRKSSGGGGSLSAEYNAESSDEERHFKRKPSRYEAVDPDSRYSGSRSHR